MQVQVRRVDLCSSYALLDAAGQVPGAVDGLVELDCCPVELMPAYAATLVEEGRRGCCDRGAIPQRQATRHASCSRQYSGQLVTVEFTAQVEQAGALGDNR